MLRVNFEAHQQYIKGMMQGPGFKKSRDWSHQRSVLQTGEKYCILNLHKKKVHDPTSVLHNGFLRYVNRDSLFRRKVFDQNDPCLPLYYLSSYMIGWYYQRHQSSTNRNKRCKRMAKALPLVHRVQNVQVRPKNTNRCFWMVWVLATMNLASGRACVCARARVCVCACVYWSSHLI